LEVGADDGRYFGVTAGIGSYASGVGLTGANSLLQSGNTLAANAAAASAAAAPSMSAIAPNFAPLAGEGSNTIAEAVKAGTMNAIGTPAVSFAPLAGVGSNTVQEAAKAGTILAAPAAATGLSGLGTKILGPTVMNAGYGVLGAGLGAGISNKGTPATPLPAPYQVPYDPNNVFSWMRPNRGGLLPGQTPRSPIPQPDPMDVYNQNIGGLNQQMYADGGDVAPVGMGLPQSAAMPQLMSAAQFGYLNARTGGRLLAPATARATTSRRCFQMANM
jgi:hypothetical protein